jgi:hypothetical protein
MSVATCKKVGQVKLVDIREFSLLYAYLISKGLQVKVPEKFDPTSVYYPEVFVAASKGMSQAY